VHTSQSIGKFSSADQTRNEWVCTNKPAAVCLKYYWSPEGQAYTRTAVAASIQKWKLGKLFTVLNRISFQIGKFSMSVYGSDNIYWSSGRRLPPNKA
jgi:hypothetical protein